MFSLLPNFWMPLIPIAKVGTKPQQIRICGENLVVYKTDANQIVVLEDKCSHKQVPLSLGQVLANGCIQCPYHGWQFDASGKCVSVPYCEPSGDRSRLNVKRIPHQVAAGSVWIFTGTDPDIFDPPELLKDNKYKQRIVTQEWQTHWTRVMENALDYSHVAFVHKGSFGAFVPKDGQEMIVKIETLPTGFRSTASGRQFQKDFYIEWRKPNCSVICFDSMGWRTHQYVLPIDENSSRIYLIDVLFRRPLPNLFLVDPLTEDRIICESNPSEVPEVSEGAYVPYDAAALRFRKHYYEERKFSISKGADAFAAAHHVDHPSSAV
ncbi:MAG: aromatic ring-hydroxylating dioxygenase subunit alpha [Candidatus Melainabacteria bacterium]|nr:aromatic ring-hydroxylating dioxygenase subunit alpha [Candidatus Melainabacteria bacterium]